MGFFDKIKSGLSKTRAAMSNTVGSVFSGFSSLDDEFYDELEENLILADQGCELVAHKRDVEIAFPMEIVLSKVSTYCELQAPVTHGADVAGVVGKACGGTYRLVVQKVAGILQESVCHKSESSGEE